MIFSQIETIAERSPDAVAVFHNDAPVTYSQFVQDIRKTAAWIGQSGRPSGDMAGLSIREHYLAWLTLFALNYHGVNAFALPTRNPQFSLAAMDLHVAYYDENDAHKAQYAELECRHVPSLDKMRKSDPQDINGSRAPNGHIYLSTSGSTGDYKLVKFDAPHAKGTALGFDCNEKTVYYGSKQFGLWTGLAVKRQVATWLSGGAVILDGRPDAAEHIFHRRFTFIELTLPLLADLEKAGVSLPSMLDPPDVRIGGAHVPSRALGQARKIFGSRVKPVYSATELIPPVLEWVPGDDMRLFRPANGRLIDVVDDSGASCPPGSEGLLKIGLIEGDARSYVDDEAGSVKAFRDGFFWPGDIAVRSEDGAVRILGKTSDVIIIGGDKYPLSPLEEKLAAALGVDACCAFPHVRQDGSTFLLVALSKVPPTSTAVDDVVTEIFPGFKETAWRSYEAFPVKGVGKVDRPLLKKWIESDLKDRLIASPGS